MDRSVGSPRTRSVVGVRGPGVSVFGSPFKYRVRLVQAFSFQPVRHESGIFRYECIKICLRHDFGISATRNMKSRLAIKFPNP